MASIGTVRIISSLSFHPTVASQRRLSRPAVLPSPMMSEDFRLLPLVRLCICLGALPYHRVALMVGRPIPLAVSEYRDFNLITPSFGVSCYAAEGEGFEPPNRLNDCRVSSAVLSASQPTFQYVLILMILSF